MTRKLVSGVLVIPMIIGTAVLLGSIAVLSIILDIKFLHRMKR